MLYQAPTYYARIFSPHKFLCAMVALSLALLPTIGLGRTGSAQTKGELRFELPANGNLRVENLRGGVIAEVWKENYVSVAAVGDSEQSSKLPAVIDRGESLLSIRLGRGPAAAPRIDLQLRIPARAHVAIV